MEQADSRWFWARMASNLRAMASTRWSGEAQIAIDVGSHIEKRVTSEDKDKPSSRSSQKLPVVSHNIVINAIETDWGIVH